MSAATSPRSHHPDIRDERDGRVATVTLDRPQSKNACTSDMWVALGATFRELSFSGARAVVVTGANGDFCTGADLGGAADGNSVDGGSFGTMTDALRVLDNASMVSLAQALEFEALAQSVNVQTEDLREALLAYMDRRPPTFEGR